MEQTRDPLCQTRGNKEVKRNRDNIIPQAGLLPDCPEYREREVN